MLEVQKYLIDHTHQELMDEYGIRIAYHPKLPLMILNYGIDSSHSSHPIVRECRGLVLHKNTHELVARGFLRFFNWGQYTKEHSNFNFSRFHVQEKVDGSLVLIYYFNKKWRINTRASFAHNAVSGFDESPVKVNLTWHEYILQGIGISNVDDLDGVLDPSLTYVCEFVSPATRIVTFYPEPKVYLLSAFKGEEELTLEKVDKIYDQLSHLFLRPAVYKLYSIQEIELFLEKISASNPTQEGVVIRDCNNNRWKMKSISYLELHHLNSQGQLQNPKNIAHFIIDPDWEEKKVYILKNFPEFEKCYNTCFCIVQDAYELLKEVWERTYKIKNQKEFALKILNETPFHSILFTIRKKYGIENQNKEHLLEEWFRSKDLIIKTLFK